LVAYLLDTVRGTVILTRSNANRHLARVGPKGICRSLSRTIGPFGCALRIIRRA